MKIFFWMILILFQISTAVADGKTGFGKVVEIYPTSSGVYYIKMEWNSNAPNASVPNPTNCTSNIDFYNSGVDEGANRLFSALLTAYSTKADVQLYYKDGTNCDPWGYSWVNSALLK